MAKGEAALEQEHGPGSATRPSGAPAAAPPLVRPAARHLRPRARGVPRLDLLAGVATAGAQPAHDRIHVVRPRTPAVGQPEGAFGAPLGAIRPDFGEPEAGRHRGDQRVLDHHGFDVEAIGEAIEKNATSGRIRRGASTISQQLARNLFLSPRRTWLRKGQEAVITTMIERALGKRRIFEIYLNVIEWGSGIYGAEAAAQHYYGKAAAELEPEEAARLAAMIPSPRSYTRNPSTPYLDERTEFLLVEMDRDYVRIP
jgi:hypothetical protein